MSIAVAATLSVDELPDPAAESRRLASRKVYRFLDGASLAPFVAAATVYARNPLCEPADVALYTVGGWDGDMPDQPFVPDGTATDDARLSRHILEEANPGGWLKMLSNNALCQVSIATGFRGPNAHLVGDAGALWQVLATAAQDLESGAATLAVLVAYDPRPGEEHLPSQRSATRAAALSLSHEQGDSDLLARLLARTSAAADRGVGALDALQDCVDVLGGEPVAS